ncbi:MAG: MlaD family protein, partial [Mycobacterium sp.]
QSLEPDKVNTIAQSIITVFQGQGGTINDILDQTASLTSALADRDQAIGEVVRNLNTVLDTTVKHQQQFDETLVDFERLITGLKDRGDPIATSVADISDAAGTVSDLLADNRPLLQSTVSSLEVIQQPLIDQKDQLNDILIRLPNALKIVGRAGGVYGDFFNFYVCDISLKLPGLQPGGPVRTVKVWSQPTGRCTPQ